MGDVKCPGCFQITTVFSHATTTVVCPSCQTVLCTPTGGKARLTEGRSFRRKQRERGSGNSYGSWNCAVCLSLCNVWGSGMMQSPLSFVFLAVLRVIHSIDDLTFVLWNHWRFG